MDRLSHVPLDLLLMITVGVHDRSGPHPYDDSENANNTENNPNPTQANEGYLYRSSPAVEQALSALKEVTILNQGRRRDPKIAVVRSTLMRGQLQPAEKGNRMSLL